MDILLPYLFAIVTSIPALVCFHIAWSGKQDETEFTTARLLLLVPTTLFPVGWLAFHAAISEPLWKEFGDSVFYYMTRGSAAWVYFVPFAAANTMVALAIVRTDFTRKTLLMSLSLLTCLAICLFFTAGNANKGWHWAYPSYACGYAYGLLLLVRSRADSKLLLRHVLLLAGWLACVVVTVVASIMRTKEMVAALPDEQPPECFIVSAAARGHRIIVRSSVDNVTGRVTNSQLATFRAFEKWMTLRRPGTHRTARSLYNAFSPPIARTIIFRWQADLVYLMLKPVELVLHCVVCRIQASRNS
jgi:hypothetical protein